MSYTFRIALAITSILFSLGALADPIEVVALPGGEHPDELGGFALSPFDEPTKGNHLCTASSFGNDVCFDDGDGNSVELYAAAPDWWEWNETNQPDHGNIFIVPGDYHLIDLILPENTFAFSLFVGANQPGRAWIQAFNDDTGYATDRTYFGVGDGDTRGYGVYSTDCSAITRITVEPFQWGFGYLSSHEGECTTSVPEPSSLALFGLGLLGVALHRSMMRRRRFT